MKKKRDIEKVKKVEDKVNLEKDDSEDDDPWWWLMQKGVKSLFLCISIFALLVRVAIGLHPYSGANTPPKFGDYEAQRHWMEITLNLSVKDWYCNSSVNDLSYWGLDYPPLTAYQSYIHGVFLKTFDPDSVVLFTSQGHESYLGKLLMRWTVLSSDVLIFFPVVLYFVLVYRATRFGMGGKSDVAWHIAMILLNPCLILIDHGHFQYNCISLGLTTAAVAAALSQKDLVASVLYCLALNHKQAQTIGPTQFFYRPKGPMQAQPNQDSTTQLACFSKWHKQRGFSISPAHVSGHHAQCVATPTASQETLTPLTRSLCSAAPAKRPENPFCTSSNLPWLLEKAS